VTSGTSPLTRGWSAYAATVVLAICTAGSAPALGAGPTEERPTRQSDRARFALILGVNRSVDQDAKKLHYADDDAARYFDLVRSLGFRTVVLSRADQDTRGLHVQSFSEAHPPTKQQLERAVGRLADEVRQARARGIATALYFVFAGHGNVRDGQGYLALEDHRLTGAQLRTRVLDRIRADVAHLIVDACSSYFVAHSRGPGGTRRSLHGFTRLRGAFSRETGLLLSTSSAQDSHEWEAFQAGVFSHQVRSGLYGAADADGDGRVSYREIGAFVDHASSSIPNARFRPKTFVRPPLAGDTLLDLRTAPQRTIEIEREHAGRYLLEDTRGVRLLDFHNSARQHVRLRRPPATGVLYLRRLADGHEYALPPSENPIRLASLDPPRPPRSSVRGAAHHAFSLLFERPFDRRVVEHYQPPLLAMKGGGVQPMRSAGVDNPTHPRESRPIAPTSPEDGAQDGPNWRTVGGWSAVGLAGAALGTAVTLSLVARSERSDVDASTSQQDAFAANRRIGRLNSGAAVLYGISAAALAAGLVTLLWPTSAAGTASSGATQVRFGGNRLSVSGRF
jgi:hypothetical protein